MLTAATAAPAMLTSGVNTGNRPTSPVMTSAPRWVAVSLICWHQVAAAREGPSWLYRLSSWLRRMPVGPGGTGLFVIFVCTGGGWCLGAVGSR